MQLLNEQVESRRKGAQIDLLNQQRVQNEQAIATLTQQLSAGRPVPPPNAEATIDRLVAEVAELQARAAALQNDLEGSQQREHALTEQLTALQATHAQLNEQNQQTVAQSLAIADHIAQAQRELQAARAENLEKTARIRDLEQQHATDQEQIATLTARLERRPQGDRALPFPPGQQPPAANIQTLQETITRLEREKQVIQTALDQKEVEFARLSLQVERVDQQVQEQRAAEGRHQEAIQEQQAIVASLQEEVARLSNTDKDAEIATLTRKNKSLTKKAKSLRSERNILRKEDKNKEFAELSLANEELTKQIALEREVLLAEQAALQQRLEALSQQAEEGKTAIPKAPPLPTRPLGGSSSSKSASATVGSAEDSSSSSSSSQPPGPANAGLFSQINNLSAVQIRKKLLPIIPVIPESVSEYYRGIFQQEFAKFVTEYHAKLEDRAGPEAAQYLPQTAVETLQRIKTQKSEERIFTFKLIPENIFGTILGAKEDTSALDKLTDRRSAIEKQHGKARGDEDIIRRRVSGWVAEEAEKIGRLQEAFLSVLHTITNDISIEEVDVSGLPGEYGTASTAVMSALQSFQQGQNLDKWVMSRKEFLATVTEKLEQITRTLDLFKALNSPPPAAPTRTSATQDDTQDEANDDWSSSDEE